MKGQKICIVVGTRPEIIKMAPIIRECQERKMSYFIIHTGQHYSFNLDKIFLQELGLPTIKYNLEVGSGLHGRQTGEILLKIEPILMKECPCIVLVEGDTNSVLAAALAASKLHIPVGHIEAGLRSYFRFMPEEINRVLVDHISDFLFAPTQDAKKNLMKEGVPKERINVTGNTIVDSVNQNLKIALNNSRVLNKLKLKKNKYFVITIHRPENVDNKRRLGNILKGLRKVATYYKLPIIYPIHPRTKKNISFFGFDKQLQSIKRVQLIEPLGFLDFLMLESFAKLILTDSGGVQEEACILNVPCVTLRDNTERPESVAVGANVVVGVNPNNIFKSVATMLNKECNWKNPFGDGKSAERIIDILISNFKVNKRNKKKAKKGNNLYRIHQPLG